MIYNSTSQYNPKENSSSFLSLSLLRFFPLCHLRKFPLVIDTSGVPIKELHINLHSDFGKDIVAHGNRGKVAILIPPMFGLGTTKV